MISAQYKKFKTLSANEILIISYPLFVLTGSFAINFYLILVSLIFLGSLILKKINIKFLNQFWIFVYLIFIIYNILNSFFSVDQFNAFRSSIGQFRFLFFSFFLMYFIQNFKNLEFILKAWLLIIIFISLDLIYQNFFLFNIFGIPISISGRPSSFFEEEVVVGAFLTFLSLPLFFYFMSEFKNLTIVNKIIYFLIYFLVLTAVTLTGERVSLLTFLVISIIIFYIFFSFKKNLIILFSFLLFFLINFKSNIIFQNRIIDMLNIIKDIYHSSWGRLWESSYMLFKDNFFFGVGLKNYRVVCDFQIDPRPDHAAQFCSTHPHNILLEILSETGFVGFVLFYLFFISLILKLSKYYKKNFKENKFLLLIFGHVLILISYAWPLKTAGSFFTTYNGSFFWLSLGIVLFCYKNLKIEK